MNKTLRALPMLAALGLSLIAPTPVDAEETAPDVATLLARSQAMREERSSVQRVHMVVTKKSGKTQLRTLTLRTRVDGTTTSSLAEVVEPAEVAGTRFLSIMNEGADPQLFLHLPKLGRTTQIKTKRAALMGSDFSPAEMDLSAWEDASHTYAGHEKITVEGVEVEVDIVDATKANPARGEYARSRLWLDATTGFPRQVEFMEADGKVIKRWLILEMAETDGVPYPKESVMESLVKGTNTRLVIEEARFNLTLDELPPSLFTKEGLAQKEESPAPTE